MKSKSYSAIASSSFLLLSISCLSQSHKPDDAPVRQIEAVAVPEDNEKADEKKADQKKADDPLGWGVGEPAAGHLVGHLDGGTGPDAADGEEGSNEDTEGETPPDVEVHPDGCAQEEMQFEGKCMAKDRVQKILDERERKALDKYRKAKKPQQAAQAAHDLLEQQVAQAQKTEDDLDEIIEVLREEKKQRKKGSKKGGF